MSDTQMRLNFMLQQASTPQDHLDVIHATRAWIATTSRLDSEQEFKKEIDELIEKAERLEKRIISKLAAG